MSIKIDDCIRINGGKSKKCEGEVISLMNTFSLVRITKDKKGVPVFSEKPTKVKKIYIEVIEPPPMEMPTEGDLKPVDSFEPNKDIFETIDKVLLENKPKEDSDSDHENSNPNELSQQIKKVTIGESYMINENNVKSPAITIDDAMNLKEENWKMKTQLESMLLFQGEACKGKDSWQMILNAAKEIGDLKWIIEDLQEQLDDSVRLEHIEELKNIINKL
jgi:hypothetical protein